MYEHYFSMQYIKAYLFLSFTLAYCYGKKYSCDMDGNQTDFDINGKEKGECDDTPENRLNKYGIDCCNETVINLRTEFYTTINYMSFQSLNNEKVSILTKFFNKPVNIIFTTGK